ncbi:hypothetical protein MCAG_03219 [Micromonospora sp. ATCC 39149]|uniref:hypothetical protein n=1 Tax=Micromonospora sp. (strain ATCC 39149 / NRRL 15099 / SCC 1413) TaxID=219305 RepID=UPI0001A503CE|nr:hypothetical protein MCAG_03219 [Micromonospora sp. ATCC 39149]
MPGAAGTRSRLSGWLSASPRRAVLVAGVAGGGSGGLLAGPVAAVVAGAYGALLVRGLVRRRLARQAELARRHGLDQLCALAADLRAGVPVLTAAATLTSPPVAPPSSPAPPFPLSLAALSSAAPPGVPDPVPIATITARSTAPLPAPGSALDIGRSGASAGPDVASTAPGLPGEDPPRSARGIGRQPVGLAAGASDAPDRLRQLARAAVRLADRTGAPLAELLERIEADARAADRGLAAAAAQAAGARATAWLLAALPLGGIGLGYGVGVDPVAVLLHTPVGGGCAVAAVVLQFVGLLWTERLGAAPGGSRS